MATVFFFFSFLLLATYRGETMVEKQWWRRERERESQTLEVFGFRDMFRLY